MMSNITVHRLSCPNGQGLHEISYTQWGDPNNPRVLLCLHGLTRNGRDFDVLAAQMATDYRVICPDMAGRGKSDWLSDPSDYHYPLYVADTLTLLSYLGAQQVDVIGTSMGGLIGMSLAAQYPTYVRRLVLNDIGAVVLRRGLLRIGRYLSQPPLHFATLDEVEQHLRLIHGQFGALTDAQWQHMTQHGARSASEGGYYLAYDPAIAVTFLEHLNDHDISLWYIWDRVRCLTLVLHGEHSDLLSREVIDQMRIGHVGLQTVTFAEIGHAPALMDETQIEIIRIWLLT